MRTLVLALVNPKVRSALKATPKIAKAVGKPLAWGLAAEGLRKVCSAVRKP